MIMIVIIVIVVIVVIIIIVIIVLYAQSTYQDFPYIILYYITHTKLWLYLLYYTYYIIIYARLYYTWCFAAESTQPAVPEHRTASPPIKSFPIKSPWVKLSGRPPYQILRTWEFPPLRIKSLLESNPSKPRLLIGELGVEVSI